ARNGAVPAIENKLSVDAYQGLSRLAQGPPRHRADAVAFRNGPALLGRKRKLFPAFCAEAPLGTPGFHWRLLRSLGSCLQIHCFLGTTDGCLCRVKQLPH